MEMPLDVQVLLKDEKDVSNLFQKVATTGRVSRTFLMDCGGLCCHGGLQQVCPDLLYKRTALLRGSRMASPTHPGG